MNVNKLVVWMKGNAKLLKIMRYLAGSQCSDLRSGAK